MEDVEVTPSARRPLVRDLVVAYLLAWAVGIGYGFLVRSSSTWDTGAAWERGMLGWFHMTLPRWLDRVMLAMPLTGTNLTILPTSPTQMTDAASHVSPALVRCALRHGEPGLAQ